MKAEEVTPERKKISRIIREIGLEYNYLLIINHLSDVISGIERSLIPKVSADKMQNLDWSSEMQAFRDGWVSLESSYPKSIRFEVNGQWGNNMKSPGY